MPTSWTLLNDPLLPTSRRRPPDQCACLFLRLVNALVSRLLWNLGYHCSAVLCGPWGKNEQGDWYRSRPSKRAQSCIEVHDIFHVDYGRPSKSSGHLALHYASRYLAEDLFLLCLCSCPLSCLCPFPCCRGRVMTSIRRLAQMRKMEIHLTSTGWRRGRPPWSVL